MKTGRYRFKILSVDGGGIRGIIPCTILKYIEEKTGNNISSMFDLIAGTSTGGIIALGLTKPKEDINVNAYSAAEMLRLYVDHGKDIFSARSRDWVSRIGAVTKTTATLTQQPYKVEKFEELLSGRFGSMRLSDSLTHVLVTTYSLEKEKPFYFSSRLAEKDDNENYEIKQIARSTSAAPTYFSPSLIDYNEEKELAMVDGGVFANNPSILAYSEAKELWKERNKTITVTIPDDVDKTQKSFEAVVTPDDRDLPFFMLSISCGHAPAKIDFSKSGDWRTAQWIQPLLSNVFMQSVAESTHYTMQYLMPPYEDATARYIRLDGMDLSKANSEMDDISPGNIKALQEVGNNFIKENKGTLDKICEILTSKDA
ncbi:MAG: patatin-like phospholipase family protein [Chitinophagaceae bacterium]|nr:patatin-like phospholipase family protein [Chitinophagaceae bacterium]MCW5926439.1 patatin-like phospholipase family protein [Chitinophagaceae bacterium]